MKTNFFLPILITAVLLSTISVKAAKYEVVTKEQFAKMSDQEKKVEVEAIKLRLEEIKDMDKSSLSSEDRKELKQELKGLRKEARQIQGVYLSVGAIIIIILLLILIL